MIEGRTTTSMLAKYCESTQAGVERNIHSSILAMEIQIKFTKSSIFFCPRRERWIGWWRRKIRQITLTAHTLYVCQQGEQGFVFYCSIPWLVFLFFIDFNFISSSQSNHGWINFSKIFESLNRYPLMTD